jgi:hypothetical protein
MWKLLSEGFNPAVPEVLGDRRGRRDENVTGCTRFVWGNQGPKLARNRILTAAIAVFDPVPATIG